MRDVDPDDLELLADQILGDAGDLDISELTVEQVTRLEWWFCACGIIADA